MKWRTHEGQRSQQNLQRLSGLLNAEWTNLSMYVLWRVEVNVNDRVAYSAHSISYKVSP